MHPAAHAALGYVLFGPLGAVVSLAPDLPIAAAWTWTDGNQRWLPRTHPLLKAQKATHSLFAVVVLAVAVLPLWVMHRASFAIPICWLLHILTDYLTHPEAERWPLF